MCYFDRIIWNCGYWKWASFRQQCEREHRQGETCGLKLPLNTEYLQKSCRLCEQMEKKMRRMKKMDQDVERWTNEGNRTATIEKTMDDRKVIYDQYLKIYNDHQDRALRSV